MNVEVAEVDGCGADFVLICGGLTSVEVLWWLDENQVFVTSDAPQLEMRPEPPSP